MLVATTKVEERKARRDGPLPDTEEIPFPCAPSRISIRVCMCVCICTHVEEEKEDGIEQGVAGGNGNDRWKGESR